MNFPNPFKLLVQRLPEPLRNRYFLSLICFFAWLIFFDRHDFYTQWKLQRTINQLDKDKAHYEQLVEEAKSDKKDIERDKEKYAREHYHMKRSNEDVFVIEKK
jgi:cell division protein DivIC